MHFIWKLIKSLFLLALIIITAAGFYAGNTAYKELFTAPWDRILGIETIVKISRPSIPWKTVTVGIGSQCLPEMVQTSEEPTLKTGITVKGSNPASRAVPESIYVSSLRKYISEFGIQCTSCRPPGPWGK